MNFSDFRFYVPPLSVWVRGQHLLSSWIYWSEVDNQENELLNTAWRMAKKIAGKSQIAIQLIKQAVDNGMEMDINKAFAYEAELFGLCFATEDQKEGMAAFLEKRPVAWKDK